MKTRRFPLKLIIVISWIAISFAGFLALTLYAGEEGAMPPVPVQWPENAGITFAPGKPNLIVFIHPRCSCSRATLDELDRLLTKIVNQVHLTLVFIRPPGRSDDWVKSPNWRRAHRLPGEIAFYIDDDNKMARAFDAETSGLALLYSTEGRLLFSGGITPARGHAGDSRGQDLILNSVEHSATEPSSAAKVYGCSLASPRAEREIQ